VTTDLQKRVASAVGLIRSGTYRYLIVRWTGLTAYQVAELIELERPKPKPETARCSKTGDLFDV
jgi:hypothetical protein